MNAPQKTDFACEQKPTLELAQQITGIVYYLKSVMDLLHSQADTVSLHNKGGEDGNRELGNLITLLNCADRYLEDIHKICEDVPGRKCAP